MRNARLVMMVVAIMVVFGMIAGCTAITDPEPIESDYTFVQANPAVLGLAKGELSVTEAVNKAEGAVLTSSDMAGNYVTIPAGALENDMELTFRISMSEDGALHFSVEGAGVPDGEHIYFTDEKKSTIAVSKDWLSQAPDMGMNIDTEEKYVVTDGGSHWLLEVQHYTIYAWIITD